MSSYVVTGSNDLVSRQIAAQLIRYNQSVTLVDSTPHYTADRTNQGRQGRVPYRVNANNDAELAHVLCNAHYVFHTLAVSARCSGAPNAHSYQTNVEGTLRLLAALRGTKVKRIVVVSSTAVYGEQHTDDIIHEGTLPQPKSACGADLLAAENYCKVAGREYGIEVVTLRCSHVYGASAGAQAPVGDVVSTLAQAVSYETSPIILGTPSDRLDMLHVDDVVRASLRAMHKPKAAGEVFNIANGQLVSLSRLVERISSLLGVVATPIYKMRDSIFPDNVDISIEKARDILNYEPRQVLDIKVVGAPHRERTCAAV